jgi:membrane protein DedA with SNARE-associated domain
VGSITSALSHLQGWPAYLIVAALVFAEDALFVGFVVPGETAAVVGGFLAYLGHVDLGVMILVVVLAAIVGDSVGFEVGRHLGPRLLAVQRLQRHQDRLDKAQDLLRRRGGPAVFLGRFVSFFRAVMPALAGTSRMHYPTFLAYNAAGGLIWGAGFVLLGYLAGHSYAAVASVVGRDVALAVGVLAAIVVGVVVLRRRRAASG